VNKFDADGRLIDAIYRRGAEGWHTDGAYNEQPFKATQLYALAVPSRGGDTLFANAYAAYDALPDRPSRRLAASRTGGPGLAAGLPSHPSHPPRNRAKIPLFRPRQDRRHRRLRPGGERCADRRAKRLHDPARCGIPPPLAEGRRRNLGQPVLVSQG